MAISPVVKALIFYFFSFFCRCCHSVLSMSSNIVLAFVCLFVAVNLSSVLLGVL